MRRGRHVRRGGKLMILAIRRDDKEKEMEGNNVNEMDAKTKGRGRERFRNMET